MPSYSGYITEEQEEQLEKLVEEGKLEDESDAVEKALRYYLFNKYGIET